MKCREVVAKRLLHVQERSFDHELLEWYIGVLAIGLARKALVNLSPDG
jgi:hypothetical protein